MKTLNTLIKKLQAMVEEDISLGECPVYVYTDHGQAFIEAGEASVEYTLAYDYYAETIPPEDVPEAQEEGEVFRMIVIGD